MSKYLVNFGYLHEYYYCESADCVVGEGYNEELRRRGTKGGVQSSLTSTQKH